MQEYDDVNQGDFWLLNIVIFIKFPTKLNRYQLSNRNSRSKSHIFSSGASCSKLVYHETWLKINPWFQFVHVHPFLWKLEKTKL